MGSIQMCSECTTERYSDMMCIVWLRLRDQTEGLGSLHN